jgi:A/G-specific adenine glycosylase
MQQPLFTPSCPPISVNAATPFVNAVTPVSTTNTLPSASFATRLLAWWDQHGRHDLPWQVGRNPYRVWLSEVMLQQTQVTTVIPYFLHFLEQFPTLEQLAHACEDEVLAQWSGLGYYSRGRNLHKTAQRLMAEYQGQLPDDPELLIQLPGIGESTANAIVSQAFDRVLPILDGNVKRVMARHAAIAGWSGQSRVQKQLWQAATERLPDQRGADYTQAIMDLGATVCKSRQPQCQHCPVQQDCSARLSDRVGEFPGRKPKKALPQKTGAFLLLTNAQQELLLHKRPGQGIWAGLWCLPQWDDEQALQSELAPFEWAQSRYSWARFEHRFTHYQLNAEVWRISLNQHPHQLIGVGEHQQRWLSAQACLALGLPQPIRRLLEAFHQQLA